MKSNNIEIQLSGYMYIVRAPITFIEINTSI